MEIGGDAADGQRPDESGRIELWLTDGAAVDLGLELSLESGDGGVGLLFLL